MNQQNTNSASNLKRQLTFLKTIDQKLEGMRRENERLLRIAGNPRVVFSRSSLAGLYRIVNSLVSAGPMYSLFSIEEWAKKTRDWLVALGKRGTGPTSEEMDWLLNSIAELGRLRDETMIEVKKKLKDSNDNAPETDGADTMEPQADIAEENLGDDISFEDVPISTDANISPVKIPPVSQEEGFPFMDEPKAQSINDSAFAPKVDQSKESGKKQEKNPTTVDDPKRFRERTSTIPLAIGDLNMLGTTSKIPPSAEHKGSGGAFWKVFALLSFVGFAVMTGLYWRELKRPHANANPPPAVTIPTPPELNAAPPIEPKDTDTVASVTAAATETPAANAPENAAKTDDKAAVKENEVEAKFSSSEKKKEKTKSTPAGSASSKTSKPETVSEPTGILFVKAPEDGSSVFVLVDGTSRGKAPVKTTLSPGLHEVVFTAEGKRSMRMVPIRADNTKTIVAVKPN